MEGFKSNTKMACYKEGGQVKYKSRKPVPKVSKEDKGPLSSMAAPTKDTAPDPEAPAMAAPTMKKGGRAKKEMGTVKKYCGGGMSKYKDGGAVGVYGAKKKSGDLDSIEKAKDIVPKKLKDGGCSTKK